MDARRAESDPLRPDVHLRLGPLNDQGVRAEPWGAFFIIACCICAALVVAMAGGIIYALALSASF